MRDSLWKKLNMFLGKYVFAPFSVVLLVAFLTSCGTEEGKTSSSDAGDYESSGEIGSGEYGSTDEFDQTNTEETTPGQTQTDIEQTTLGQIDTEQATLEETTPEETTSNKVTEPSTTKPVQSTTKPTTTSPEEPSKEEETTKPKDYDINLEMPSADGKLTSDLNGYVIDYSNIDSGYVMIKAKVDAEAVVQVRIGDKKGALVGQYVLKISNNYVAIPLTKGNETYCVRIMQKNPATGKYAEKNAITVTPKISNERKPYRIPNVYVYYMKSSTAVKLSYELCDGLTSDEQKVKAIYNYIVKNIKYDYAFAKTATAGYMDSERCLKTKSGICGDYSVLFATMCRAQGIPCVVVEGYVTADGDVYHAWNQVYYNKEWHFFDTTFDAGGGKGKNYLESFRY